MSHLFSNTTDLKAAAVFRAHTDIDNGLALDQTLQESHRQSAEMSKQPPTPPTHVVRLCVEHISFTITVVDFQHIFEQFRSSAVCPAHAFSTYIRRLFRTFWRTLAFETAAAACSAFS